MKASDVRLHKKDRQRLYIWLQMHKGYDRLTERQQQVIDCFAAGMNYEETAKLMGTKRSAPYSMLVRTILPRYKPNIWDHVNSLPDALRLLAKEVEDANRPANSKQRVASPAYG